MTRTLPLSRFEQPTLPALVKARAADKPEKVFIRWIDPACPDQAPRDITIAAFARGLGHCAAYLRSTGGEPGARVLLLAENSPEWQMVSLGTQSLRAEPAALFANLSGEQASSIAVRVKPRVVFVSSQKQWDKLAPVAGELMAAGLASVISGEALVPETVPTSLSIVSLEAMLADAAFDLDTEAFARLADAVGEEDPFLLLFTSGTTGRPKGVRLPQRSILAAIAGGAGCCGTGPDDVGVHFLPFAHIAAHDQFFLALGQGHSLAMAARKDDIDRALALGPTYLFSVPLLYERMRAAVQTKLDHLPGPVSRLAASAVEAAARVRVDGSRSLGDRALVSVADMLVGKAVRKRLGGRIRALFTGGAPASPALFRFFEALAIPFVELYGMSETGGLIAANVFSRPRQPSSVGFLSPDHEARFSEDGELLIRGRLMFTGYLEAEDNRGAFDAEGFFHTGDLGRVDAEGVLRVEGRKKHLLVLSTGKKLAPEPLELAISSMTPFEGAVVLGEGKPFVAAAVFVARDELAKLAAAGRDAAETLLPRVRQSLQGFAEFELPKRLLIIPGAPHEHPLLVTPTLKIRRDAVTKFLGDSLGHLWDPRPMHGDAAHGAV